MNLDKIARIHTTTKYALSMRRVSEKFENPAWSINGNALKSLDSKGLGNGIKDRLKLQKGLRCSGAGDDVTFVRHGTYHEMCQGFYGNLLHLIGCNDANRRLTTDHDVGFFIHLEVAQRATHIGDVGVVVLLDQNGWGQLFRDDVDILAHGVSRTRNGAK